MQEERRRYRSLKRVAHVYEYTARWSVISDALHWEATVRCDGQFKGKPGGQTSLTHGQDPRALVRSYVERCIETGMGVEN